MIPADVALTVREGRLSLQAQDTSLTAIFEAVGQQLSIEVVTHIPADERITIAFDQLPLGEALKRFGAAQGTDGPGGAIISIPAETPLSGAQSLLRR